VVLALVIIVLQPKYAIIEEAVAVVEQEVRLVDIITTNNHGMDQIMAPVETCEVVIVNQILLVVTNVINNKQPVTVVIVKQIIVGGTVRHEK
jgi:hypothetical protein